LANHKKKTSKELQGSVEKGDKRFNSPKGSKVKKVFLLLNKAKHFLDL